MTGLEAKKASMFSGAHINSTENRAVMHVALRAPKEKTLFVDGVNVVPEVHSVLQKIETFSNKVRNGEWVGATGKPLTSIISIGIGGSCKYLTFFSSSEAAITQSIFFRFGS